MTDGTIAEITGGGQHDIEATQPSLKNTLFDLKRKVKQVPVEFMENGGRFSPVYFLKTGEEVFGPSYTINVSYISTLKSEKANLSAFPLLEQKVTV